MDIKQKIVNILQSKARFNLDKPYNLIEMDEPKFKEAIDELTELFNLHIVSRSKPIKEETKNHIKDIAEYTKTINEMRLKDLDIHLDYGQTIEDKTLS